MHLLSAAAGYEPRRLYNVAEFLMNDKDNSGKVSVEEVMQILFLRYGRQLLDSVRAAVLRAASALAVLISDVARSNWRRSSAQATRTAARTTCRCPSSCTLSTSLRPSSFA